METFIIGYMRGRLLVAALTICVLDLDQRSCGTSLQVQAYMRYASFDHSGRDGRSDAQCCDGHYCSPVVSVTPFRSFVCT